MRRAAKRTRKTGADRRLAEALEQQAATSDILRLISSSPSNVQPVFDTILASALRLCAASTGAIFAFDGRAFRLAAVSADVSADFQAYLHDAVIAPGPETPLRRVGLEPRVCHVADILADPSFSPPEAYRREGMRTSLAVPMLQQGRLVGALTFHRRRARPFTTRQVALLQTFADQAVIAIENVRLLTELQAKNRALTDAHAQMGEALEQQTATAEILQVISSSPTELQAVFDTIVANAVRLCAAAFGGLQRLEGDRTTLDAQYGVPADELAILQRDVFPLPVSRDSATGRAILDRAVTHIRDIREDPDFRTPRLQSMQSYRTILAVPMLREGVPIGALALWRREVRPFTEREIRIVRTFADQAVIAIENVRLFNETQEALEQQTATSEILRVISRSPTDVQPVFDAVAESTARLLEAEDVGISRVQGDVLVVVAGRGPLYAAFEPGMRYPLSRGSVSGRALIDQTVMHVLDLAALSEEEFPVGRDLQRRFGHRTMVAAPLIREGTPIGVINVFRMQARRFTDQQIELLKTFADQAVIAIENVRLFKELQARTQELTRSVAELTALGEVGRALSSTLDLETVLQTIVTRAVEIAGTAGCTIWEYDEPRAEFRLRMSHYADQDDAALLQVPGRVMTISKGQGVTTGVMERRAPVQIGDITIEGAYESPIRQPLIAAGHRALLGVPLLSEDEVIGVLAVTRKTPGEFPPEVIQLLQTFATQSALAIQNARLFHEIADKSRQLEVASQHKSEFLANMSHELRTPLNAVIGFSEVLAEGMFGEINAKQAEYLRDILDSGRHLLSLINDILDLSKIEAGHMELEAADFDLPGVIANALILVRERATRHGIGLGQTIDPHLGTVRADERKVKQVLLNLLSNAVKFTAEGGRIDVTARAHDGCAEIAVSDTGVGIAPEDQAAVFEEFRQVGSAAKKVEGTGLGLALARKFVELHGGRIWVQSEAGRGATFTFTLPLPR